MTQPKRPLKVFLCHAHADRDAVRTLYTRLTNDGVDAWLDKEKLLPGQDWELEIKKAVREADVVVVCLSKQFNQAGFRQKEVRLALDTAMEKPEGEIFIIPARLEECDNLESLRKWHWVNLFEEDGYEMLMRALLARGTVIGASLQKKNSSRVKVNSQTVVEENSSLLSEKSLDKMQGQNKIGDKLLKYFSKNIDGVLVLVLLALVVFGLFSLPTQLKLSVVEFVSGFFKFPSQSSPTSTPTSLPIETQDVDYYLMLGQEYFDSGDYEKAAGSFSSAILLDPSLSLAYYKRGVSYLEIDKVNEAEADLEKSLELSQNSFALSLGFARVYLLQEKYGSAFIKIEEASSLVQTSQEQALVYYWRALIQEKRNMSQDALQNWDALLNMPADVITIEMLSVARAHKEILVLSTATP